MTKIKVICKGCCDYTFTNVRFEYDWSSNEEHMGDVEIRDGKLYIQNYYIPIRRNLVESAFHEFKSLGSNTAYAELEFLIADDGGYRISCERSNNTGSYILGKILGFSLAKHYYPPCLGERDY